MGTGSTRNIFKKKKQLEDGEELWPFVFYLNLGKYQNYSLELFEKFSMRQFPLEHADSLK